MIVVDSSVVVAVFKNEPDADDLISRLLSFERRVISAANWLEAAIVFEGKGEFGETSAFENIIDELVVDVLPVAPEHARIARDAFKRYGKGRGPARGEAGKHPKLNFGDCFAYALAKALDAPLMFKGGDFALTDVKQA